MIPCLLQGAEKVLATLFSLALDALLNVGENAVQRSGVRGTKFQKLTGQLPVHADFIEIVGVDGFAVEGQNLIPVVGHADRAQGGLNGVGGTEGKHEGDHADDQHDGEESLLVFAEIAEGMKGHWQSSL